jgi:hypothetical protein
MEVLDELITRLEQYKEQLPELTAEILNDNASLIEDLNISQLQQGMRSDGEVLPDYSPVSVMKYGKPPGPIRLFDTGAFYRAIIAKANPLALEFDNTDSKRGKLTLRFGEEIIGLSDDNIVIVQEEIVIPGLIERTENYFII